jgi:hypothetical protein
MDSEPEKVGMELAYIGGEGQGKQMKLQKILVAMMISGLVGACGQVAQNVQASLDENQTSIQLSCALSNLNALTKTGDGGNGRLGSVAVAGDGGNGRLLTAPKMGDGGNGRLATVAVAGDGGNGRSIRIPLNTALQCASYVVEISGVCNDCGSVLVETGRDAVTVAVNEDGTFNYQFTTSSKEGIALTPLSF